MLLLGPSLFICYINDLPYHIKSKIRMYADDTLVYSPISMLNDCIQLQKGLLVYIRKNRLKNGKWSLIHLNVNFLRLQTEGHLSSLHLIVILWPRGICLIYMPKPEGIYIRQIPSGHGISNIYHSGMLT